MHVVHHFTEIRKAGGGVPRAVLDLVRALADAGEDVTLLSASGSDVPETWAKGETGNVRNVALESVARPFQLLSRQGLEPVAEAVTSADVVHLHGLWRPRNTQIARLARSLGRAYVLSPHGMLNDWAMAQRTWLKTIHYRLFERHNLSAARVVLFATARERDQALRWIPHERLSVVPLAVDLEPYKRLPEAGRFEREHPEIAAGTPVVLMLGRLHPGKRPEILIEAIADLRSNGVECQLVLAGEGEPAYVERLRQRVHDQGIARHTHFLGLVSGQDKLSVYQRADLMVLPTIAENFGLVLFESLACGTPVLTTRGADSWSEVSSSGGGRIVEPTPEAFAANIAELLADRQQRSEMGRRGRQWVFDWLDPQVVTERYKTMYRGAAGRDGNRK